MFEDILSGLSAVVHPSVIAAMVIGTAIGIIVGALPGFTATMSIALLIPLTFEWSALVGLAAMAGIYNGAMYGGAIPAILMNIPGTPAGIVTTFDGYPMAQQGKASLALRLALLGSTVGAFLSAVVLLTMAPPLAWVALAFGPVEYFWLAVFGMTTLAALCSDSVIKGAISALFGLSLGTVGIDSITGVHRFTTGNSALIDGIPIVVLLIGLYAIPQALLLASRPSFKGHYTEWKQTAVSLRDLFSSWKVALRSSCIGIVVGLMPGAGGNIASFISYSDAKRNSRHPERFGKGEPDGVVASETANNADNASSLVPSLALGIPGNSVAAVMLGGFLIHGMRPGPGLFTSEGTVVFGFMWAMMLTALIMLVLGWYGSRLFALVLRIPSVLMAPIIIVFCVLGTYSLRSNLFDVALMFGFGLLGLLMIQAKIPLAPAVLALILGPMAESELRRAMLIGRNDIAILFSSPIALILVTLIIAVVIGPPLRRRWSQWRHDKSPSASD